MKYFGCLLALLLPHLASAQAVLPNTLGTRQVIVLNIKPDTTPEPWPASFPESQIAAADAIYASESNGLTRIAGTSSPWLSVPDIDPCTNWLLLSSLADIAATNSGIDLTGKIKVYAMPPHYCGAVRAFASGNRIWIYGDWSFSVLAHELGHVFGLGHAHAMRCGGLIYDATSCAGWLDTGNSFSLMGGAPRWFDAFEKALLGWMGTSSTPPITTVQAAGDYTLEATDAPVTGRPKAIKILRGINPATSERSYVYLERRVDIPGVLVSLDGSFANNEWLLDLTPGSWNGFADAALSVGETFTAPSDGIAVHLLATDATTATVAVTIPGTALSCVPATQTIPVGTYTTLTATGGTGSYWWDAVVDGALYQQGTANPWTFYAPFAGTYTYQVTSGARTATCQLIVAASLPPPPIDCVQGSWYLTGTVDSYSEWIVVADHQERTYTMTSTWQRDTLTQPANGGLACGPSTQTTTDIAIETRPMPVVLDTIKPAVSLAVVANGKSGNYTVTILVSDNVGVVSGQLYVDGKLSVSYSTSWSGTVSAGKKGPHTFVAHAQDAAGNDGVASVTK